MSDYYLFHHGIKGMKWGIRRYQPYGRGYSRKGGEDGKETGKAKRLGGKIKKGLAAAGAAVGIGAVAYGSSRLAKAANKESLFEQNIKSGKDKPNISPAEKISKETKNSFDSAQGIVRSAGKIKKLTTPQENRAKGLSDEELRKRINRINLERQYNDLTSADTGRGFEVASEVLSIAGGVASIAASAATVYAVARKLK